MDGIIKTRSGKAAGPNLICILLTMKCPLETGPSPTPTNTEGFPNLPPNNREGAKRSFVSDPFLKKEAKEGGILISTLHVSPEKRRRGGECSVEFRRISSYLIGGERRCPTSPPMERGATFFRP